MRGCVRFVMAAAVACSFGAAPASAETPFGLLSYAAPNGFQHSQCAAAPCLLYSQSPVYAAPADGVIVRWHYDAICNSGPNAAPSGQLRLLTFRRAADKLTLKGRSAPHTATECSNVDVPARVAVAAGDEIGYEIDTANLRMTAITESGRSLFRVEPLPADGVEVDDGTQMSASQKLLITAWLEPDFDKDGFGDETQDADDDGDGLSDADETSPGSNPLDPDSDDDGIGDATDRCPKAAGTAPSGCPGDTDADGIPDTTESTLGSNPNSADSDGDGVADGSDRCIMTAGVAPGGCPAADLPPSVAFVAPAAGAALSAAGVKLIATASDDRGVAAVEFIDDEAVVCRDTAAPYECQYTPGDGDVGQNLLVARAIDSAGQQAVALRSVSVGRFTATGLSNNSSRKGRRITSAGVLSLPAGLTKKRGCAGRVSIQIKAGKRTVSRRVVRLASDCTYRSVLTLRRGGRLSVIIRFEGNAVVGALRGPTKRLA